MKPGVTLLRGVALVCTSLALTACGGPMTEEEAATVETEALASQEAEVGSCGTWSDWYWDGHSFTCVVVLACGGTWDEYGEYHPIPAAREQHYSYRVCFDQYGNYTHTEYQYTEGRIMYCGC